MAQHTRFSATVSFESDTQPVRTHRQEFVVASAVKATRLAVNAARRAYPGVHYRSMVVVLERMGQVQVDGKDGRP
jgi:hypothetical protein